MVSIRRRQLLLAAGTLLGLPTGAMAQPAGKMHRVSLFFLISPVSVMSGPEPSHPAARAFLQALRALGYEEGRNLMYEPRSVEGKYDQIQAVVAELVRSKVDVIVASGTDIPMEAKKVTTTVPIVSDSLTDPVEIGLVQSLARPGGNITGLTYAADQAKRLELLKEAVPGLSRVAYLGTKKSWESPSAEAIRAAARSLNVTLLGLSEIGPRGIDFDAIARVRPDALFVATAPENYGHRRAIVDFVTKTRQPATFSGREFVEMGGLMSYGDHHLPRMRRAAAYVDKILRGAKPAELPIEQPSTYELVINLKTATSLGISIPQSVLLRADRVIE